MYNVLIDLRSRLKLYISRLRCSTCYAPYSPRCPIYLCESGSEFEQNKIKFSVERRPSVTHPMAFMPHFPISFDLKSEVHFTKTFDAARLVAYPDKERSTRNVLYMEVCCSKCSNFKELEIDLDDFLPKRYSRANVTRLLEFPDEED